MEIWDRIKKEFTGERRKFAWFVAVVLVVFVFSWLFGSGNTIVHWVRAKKEIRRQDAQIEEYQRQIQEIFCIVEYVARKPGMTYFFAYALCPFPLDDFR